MTDTIDTAVYLIPQQTPGNDKEATFKTKQSHSPFLVYVLSPNITWSASTTYHRNFKTSNMTDVGSEAGIGYSSGNT